MSIELSVGQIWKYQTRPGESDSRITIVEIDHDDPEYGQIVHVYISGLNIPNPQAPGGKTVFISHLPYQAEALQESLTELDHQPEDQAEPLPDFQEGYKLWRKAFENSEAGVFLIPVAEAIQSVAGTVGKP